MYRQNKVDNPYPDFDGEPRFNHVNYDAYGMGMAIEDGYFLARAFQSADPSCLQSISDCRSTYESDGVEYVNRQVDFARVLGQRFHRSPKPLAWLRDLVFDNTGILRKTCDQGLLGSCGDHEPLAKGVAC